MVMASSTASAGSKRHAVEDEDLLQSDQTRESKRQKSAKKSSSNGKQNISHYFAPKNTKKGDRSALSGSDDHESKPLPRKVSAEEVSQRRDRSISPPIRSRRKKTLQTVDKGDAENKRPKEPERDADDNSEAQFLHISEHIGDLFDAPANSLLIHACNCKGWWGKGIAEAFKEKYPAAFKVYQAHCKKTSERQLVGKALLIPPQPNDRHQHYVGCVFTSAAPGKYKYCDDPSDSHRTSGYSRWDFFFFFFFLPSSTHTPCKLAGPDLLSSSICLANFHEYANIT